MPEQTFPGVPITEQRPGQGTQAFPGTPIVGPVDPAQKEPAPSVPFGAAPALDPAPQVGSRLPSTMEETGEAITDIADPFLQGLTLGGGDELTAAAMAATSDKTYEEALAEVRARSDEISERLGMGANVAEVGGNLVLGSRLGPAGMAAGAALGLPKLATFGLTGAAGGAVAGALSADEDRGTAAVQGGLAGGTLGIVLPVTGRLAGRVLSGAIDRISKAIGDPTRTNAARRRSVELMARALDRDEITPQQAADELRRMGINATVADLGENTRSLAGATQNVPGRGQAVGAATLNTRQAGQTSRVSGIVNRALNRNQTLRQSRTALIADRKAAADPLYAAAYRRGVEFTPELQELFNRPAIRDNWQRAQTIARNEGIELPRIFVTDAQGNLTLNTRVAPTMQAIDFIKRGMDDFIETSRDSLTGRIKGDLAQGVSTARRALLDLMDNQNPDYAAARAAFAGRSASIDALEQGRNLGRSLNVRGGDRFDVDQILEDLQGMNDGEKAFFRQGLGQGLIDIIEATGDQADAVKRLVGTEIRRGRLRAAFPDAETFTRFMSDLGVEERFFDTTTAVLRGSPTAPRLAAQADLAAAPTDASLFERALNMARSPGGAVADAASSAVRAMRKPSPELSAELSRLMFSQGDEAVNALRQVGIPAPLNRNALAALLAAEAQAGSQ